MATGRTGADRPYPGARRSIHQRKDFTSYGVAAAVARVVRAVIRDEKRIFMVSVPAAPEYGIGMVALSLPCVVAAAGAERQLLLPMSAQEQTLLQRSAAILDQAYRSLNPGSSATGPTIAATDLATKTSADP
jgi:L-lactate dehydrogenase